MPHRRQNQHARTRLWGNGHQSLERNPEKSALPGSHPRRFIERFGGRGRGRRAGRSPRRFHRRHRYRRLDPHPRGLLRRVRAEDLVRPDQPRGRTSGGFQPGLRRPVCTQPRHDRARDGADGYVVRHMRASGETASRRRQRDRRARRRRDASRGAGPRGRRIGIHRSADARGRLRRRPHHHRSGKLVRLRPSGRSTGARR